MEKSMHDEFFTHNLKFTGKNESHRKLSSSFARLVLASSVCDLITITPFIVQEHLAEFEPAAVLFHLISISREKQRRRVRRWRRRSRYGGEAGQRTERDLNAPSCHTTRGLDKVLSGNWSEQDLWNIYLSDWLGVWHHLNLWTFYCVQKGSLECDVIVLKENVSSLQFGYNFNSHNDSEFITLIASVSKHNNIVAYTFFLACNRRCWA